MIAFDLPGVGEIQDPQGEIARSAYSCFQRPAIFIGKVAFWNLKSSVGGPMCQLSPVTFHGDTIFCIDYQNQPFTPMRPIVENMGLNWGSQSAKLNANKDRWTVAMIATVAQDGIEREMLSMPVRKLPAYLASISPKKVKPELRAKIELYQAESDDALWNYWMNGRAERPASTPKPSPISRRTDPERKALTAIINTWVGMAPIHYAAARAQVNAHFGVTSVDALTVAQVKEAIQWVQGKIDTLPPALLTTPRQADAVEEDLAFIRACAREIMERERRIYFTLRDTLPPLHGVTRPFALRLHESMEAGCIVLDSALKQVENNARLVLEYTRG